MITIATSAINTNNSFELSQKRYEDSLKNYYTNWNNNNFNSSMEQQNSTSAIPFSNVLQTQIDASNGFTEVKNDTRYIQIQPLDTTLSSSISIPFQGTSASSIPVSSANNSGSVTQPNTLSISASTTEDSQTQNTDLKDQSTVVAKMENSTNKTDLTANSLYSYLTGEETPSTEDKVKVDSILNRLSLLTSTQSGSLFTQSDVLSSLQSSASTAGLSGNSLSSLDALSSLQSAASTTGLSGSSLSALAALNGESSIQALLKTVYGNATNNTLTF